VRWAIRQSNRLPRPGRGPIRLLEKTPENCLRLDFLLALFPDARVIYLTRDGRDNVNSLIEGWRQPHLFPGYEVPVPIRIPGDRRGRWAFTLIPGWRDLTASPLEEVCAWQWRRCNEAVLAHRAAHPGVPYLTVPYEDLVARPAAVLAAIADFIDVAYGELAHFAGRLPQVNVVSPPGAEKWRTRNPQAIAAVLPILRPLQQQLGYDSNVS
jgi:hypothetical protein